MKAEKAEITTENTLSKALDNIKKKFGSEAIMDFSSDAPVDIIPTGCLSLDNALGIGGFPRGRIMEIYSESSVGKSSLMLSVVSEAQKLGKVAYLDSEFSLSESHSRKLGVDTNPNNLIVVQNECAQDNFDIIETLVETGEFSLIVVDSVASLVPREEINGEFGDSVMGKMGWLMSQAMRKLVGSVAKSNTCLVFLNQMRSKVGVVFGSPDVTTGGKALPFYASIRIQLKKTNADLIKKGEEVIGHVIHAKIVKNKLAAPLKEAQFDFLYTEGIDKLSDLIDIGVEKGVIERGGSWFTVEGERLQGKERAKTYLKDNPKVAENLRNKLKDKSHELK